MSYMFGDSNNLETIYVHNDFDISKVIDSSDMFTNCSNLVGGNGTAYNSSNVTATYAKIDRTDVPGYFTQAS